MFKIKQNRRGRYISYTLTKIGYGFECTLIDGLKPYASMCARLKSFSLNQNTGVRLIYNSVSCSKDGKQTNDDPTKLD
jgi:hypothetical protein